jgi:2-oxoglutarate dehydrogenase E1 component
VSGEKRARDIRRLIVCSGKVYVDLAGSDLYEEHGQTAVVRLEQLYPFPEKELTEILVRYPRLEEVTWVQEEPENMGPWESVRPALQEVIEERWPLRHVARPRSASPAEGSMTHHRINTEALIRLAFRMEGSGVDQEDSDIMAENIS